MKSAIIVIIVVVLIGLGFIFLKGNNTTNVNVTETPTPTPSTPTPSGVPVGAGAGVDAGGINPNATVKEFTVTAKNFSFSPNTMTVKKGDKVKITFVNSEGFHDFRIDEFGAAVKQVQAPATETLEFTASKVGSFEYYCSVGSHRSMGMVGTLTVTE